MSRKYECKLDPRYKLPRLIYRGELPPSKHYIRKQKSPKIEEVDDSNQSKTRPTITAIKTTQQSYSAEITLNVEDENGSIFECNRVAAADGGNALTEEELITMKNKTLHIHIRSHHECPECSIDNIKIELQAEYILVKFPQHRVYGQKYDSPRFIFLKTLCRELPTVPDCCISSQSDSRSRWKKPDAQTAD